MTQIQTKFKQTEIGLIPEDWEVVELGDVAGVQNGYAFKSEEFSSSGIPILKIKNVASGRIIIDDLNFYSKPIEFLGNYIIRKGDILVSMTGSHISQISSAVGKVAFYGLDSISLLNQRVGKIYPLGNKVNNLFLWYNLYQSESQLYWGNKAGGSANQSNISPGIIKSYRFPLPPLPEQKAIAEIFSSLDDKIELLEKQNKTLENIGQALFQSWFVDFEGFQNDLVESEMGMIPRGWKVGKVGDLVDFIVDNRGKTPETVEPNEFDYIPLIEINALIGTGRCVNVNLAKKGVTNEVFETWFRKGHPERGDILFSTVGSIGEIALIFDEKICIAQNIVSLRPKIGGVFVYELLSYIKPNLLGLDISTVQPSIKLPHLLNFEILIPNNEIIEEFVLKSEDISEKIYKNNLQIQTLSNLRDSLLPRLMSGKIRVV